MEENQQFKIESVDELKQVYGKYGEWWNPLKEEIKDFNMDEAYRWIAKHATGKVCLDVKQNEENFKVIPNPLKPQEQLEIEISDDRVYAKCGESELEVTNPSEDLKAFVEFMDVIQADEEYKEDFLTKYPMTTDEAFEDKEPEEMEECLCEEGLKDDIQEREEIQSIFWEDGKWFALTQNGRIPFSEKTSKEHDEIVDEDSRICIVLDKEHSYDEAFKVADTIQDRFKVSFAISRLDGRAMEVSNENQSISSEPQEVDFSEEEETVVNGLLWINGNWYVSTNSNPIRIASPELVEFFQLNSLNAHV